MAYEGAREVVASAARTTTGNSGALRLSGGVKLNLFADVTAASGTTPSLTLSVEWSYDGTNFATPDTPDAFTAVTAAAKKMKQLDVKAPLYRIVWTITGTTPSFTFSIREYLT